METAEKIARFAGPIQPPGTPPDLRQAARQAPTFPPCLTASLRHPAVIQWQSLAEPRHCQANALILTRLRPRQVMPPALPRLRTA